jgi:hypothetical protein
MLDRMQIGLLLGMNILGIEVNGNNYRRICDAIYEAQKIGVYISPARIEFNERTGHAYSPLSHEDGGSPSRNLSDDVWEIERALAAGYEPRGWKLDPGSAKKLRRLRLKLAA